MTEDFMRVADICVSLSVLLFILWNVKTFYTNLQDRYEGFVDNVLNKNNEREQKYIDTVDRLSSALSTIQSIQEDIKNIKDQLRK